MYNKYIGKLSYWPLFVFAFLFCTFIAGQAAPYPTLSGNGNTPKRFWLTYQNLIQGVNSNNPVDNAAFVPPSQAASPENVFTGTLLLNSDDLKTKSNFHVLYSTKKSKYGNGTADNTIDNDDPNTHYMPNFSFQFVQDGSNLIPLLRTYQVEDPTTGHPIWEYIVGPGRVWDEKSDNGYSRAAFTFALVEKGENCVHNGLMMFLFKGDGSISNVWYQITTETCAYFKFDMWGMAGAQFIPQNISNAADVISKFKQEVASQLNLYSIDNLAAAVGGNLNPDDLEPAYDPNNAHNNFNEFPNPYESPAQHNPVHLTNYGVLYKDNIYTGWVRTRSGPYPYPQWMVYPLYSWSKSDFIGNAVALLAQLNPNGVPKSPTNNTLIRIEDLKVSDWINTNGDTTWSDVTLGNLINMTSGHFINSTPHLADENLLSTELNFFNVLDNQGKINFALSGYPDQNVAPGTLFVYHTSDFYLAGRILELLTKKLYGGETLLQLMQDNIYTPLKLSALYQHPKVTYDAVKQPFSAYGAFAYADDIAKMSRFIAMDKGAINGNQVLDLDHVNNFLQLTSDMGSHPPINSTFRYLQGYWSKHLTSVAGCNPRIVFESGFGGLSKVFGTKGNNNPDGWVYWYIADDSAFFYSSAINALASSIGCPAVGNW